MRALGESVVVPVGGRVSLSFLPACKLLPDIDWLFILPGRKTRGHPVNHAMEGTQIPDRMGADAKESYPVTLPHDWTRDRKPPHARCGVLLRFYFFAVALRRPATVLRGPFRVRAFVRVRCPRTGKPRR